MSVIFTKILNTWNESYKTTRSDIVQIVCKNAEELLLLNFMYESWLNEITSLSSSSMKLLRRLINNLRMTTSEFSSTNLEVLWLRNVMWQKFFQLLRLRWRSVQLKSNNLSFRRTMIIYMKHEVRRILLI